MAARLAPGVVFALLGSAFSVGLVAQRAAINQRAMWVSVLDGDGKPVSDLKPDEFVIRVDGLKREVLSAEPATSPMQVAVLVDNSQAAGPYLNDARRALLPFVRTLAGKNEVALVALASRPTILANYTTSAGQLEKSLGRLFPEQNSAAYLLDGLIEVSQGLKKREAMRPVIVSITTAGPEFSSRYHDLVLTPLIESGAAYHAIFVGPPPSGIDDETVQRDIVLDQGTRRTGGRFDNLLSSSTLPTRLQEVAAELTHQYRVTYGQPQSLIPPERFDVSVTRPGLTVRGTPVRESRGQ